MTNVPQKAILDFYSSPGVMTSFGKYEKVIKKLPKDVPALAAIIQGLIIHAYAAEPFYGVTFNHERLAESHIRPVKMMLDMLMNRENKSLTETRQPEKRLVGVCHHFAKLLIAMLRVKGIPARMRYGFGNYFTPGRYEDHSLCEYWHAKEKRWVLADPQFDEIWRNQLHIRHDAMDVPRGCFVTPAEAWKQCREDRISPEAFGIFELRGLWFIAGNLVKDVAALNKMEMLQWDAWGVMPRPNNSMRDKKRLQFFDALAKLASDPDGSFGELQKMYRKKTNRLLVPARVFNADRRHLEKV